MLKIISKCLKWTLLMLFTLVFLFIVMISYQKGTRESVDLSGIQYEKCWTSALEETKSRCGLMSVPISYSNETSGTRAFSFAILPALNPEEIGKINKPLVFLVGGPGPAGTYKAHAFKKGAPNEFLRKNRDVILVDYRGSGMSIPHDGCEMPSGLLSAISCLKAVYVADSDEFRSAIFAKDTNRLIEALGYDSVIIYGGSYGTRVALTMLRDTPEHISHAIIDGVFPIEINGLTQGAHAILAGLALIAERCEANSDCHNKFGAMRPKIEKLNNKWAARDDIELLLYYLAKYSHFPQAPLLINKLSELPANESADLLIKIATLSSSYQTRLKSKKPKFSKKDTSRAMSIPMAIGIVCSEESAFTQDQPLDRKRHGFSNQFVESVANISAGAPLSASQAKILCGLLGIDSAAEIEKEAIKSDIPTLILSGGMDLQTSFEWGKQVKSNLSNSQHYIMPFSNHIVMADKDDCGRSLITQFLSSSSNKIDASCIQKYPIADFLLESGDISQDFKHPY